ncbi:uncharacterized protein [Apostichopus japonicus]|uniref:uncharacterized protein isoform X2 n=1 Tax=Stichopus japonicus TaxID=307972 RepID=UPI003AB15F82
MSDASTHVKDHEAKAVTNGHKETSTEGSPALIDSSPLKPLADEVPEKRKLGEDESTEDDTEEEDMQGVEEDPYKYLRDGVEYDSQEDEDYKPPGEVKDAFDDSAASDEFKEGDTDEDDVNVNPKDILEKKTRGKKLQGDTKGSEVIEGSLKGEEKTGPIQLEQQSTHEEKSK